MKMFSTVWLTLFLLAMVTQTIDAQEANRPQRVSTSVGIYDVQSPEDIHGFSAAEIRELVRLENQRWQGVDTFPHPVLVYAFEERTFHYTGGRFQNEEITYRLRTPRTIRFGRRYPLIVHLHGHGDDSLTHAHSVLPFLIGPDQQDFFMLVTQAPRTGADAGWRFQPATEDGSLDVLVAAIAHVIAENPIDTNRITATGISGGGSGVWQLLLRHPDMFAGAMPTACGAPQIPQPAALRQTPIWAINNRGDIDPTSIRAAMRMINGAGGSMVLTETNTPGHNSWIPAMEDYNGIQWMLAQRRGSWFAPAPGTIVNNPSSSLLVFVMYIVPFALLVFLVFYLREEIGEQIATVWQALQERNGKK